MTNSQQLRLWPAVFISVVYVAMQMTGFPFGPNKIIHGWLALLVWWVLFSRVPWKQRFVGLGLLGGLGLLPRLLMHHTMGFAIFSYVVPSVTTLIVLVWLVSSWLRWERRRWIGLGAGVLTLFMWTLVRIDGVSGELVPTFAYRWQDSAEATFLKNEVATGQNKDQHVLNNSTDGVPPAISNVASDWPGFRGFGRNGVVSSSQLSGANVRHWASEPPRELWRRPLGPAWSSIAVAGEHVLTQEQRGEYEATVCYHADTGEELWSHRHEARFDTMLAGVGPRATPTVAGDRVYAMGALGMVTCLSLNSGGTLWEYDIATETGSKGPQWGFSSSPLVLEDSVVLYGGGENENALVALLPDDDGTEVWKADVGTPSYSSPQLAKLCGVDQILMFTSFGLESFDPKSGAKLWSYEWPSSDAMEARIIQPMIVSDDSVLVGSESKTIRLQISHDGKNWSASEIWSTRQTKPDFNDFVALNGYAYGFDGSIFCCLDIETGKRTWRHRGYGKGQVLLLQDDALLLVLSESGDVSLVPANPEQHETLARFHAVTGKTWNHPSIAAGRLYVRNASELACFEL